jgi:hypothetical protein
MSKNPSDRRPTPRSPIDDDSSREKVGTESSNQDGLLRLRHTNNIAREQGCEMTAL